MRPYLCAVVAALGVALAAASASAETVKLQSGSYASFREVLSRQPAAETVAIDATLTFPDRIRDRHPAVVVVHTIGGYLEPNEGWHAAEFRKAGFATLTYDSPSARSMRPPAVLQDGGPPWASAIAEAYAALRLLAADPRIDSSRIAIVGFSFGGEVAHVAAFEPVRAALAPDNVRFAAHVAYYPAGVFGFVAEQGAYTGAPILMLLGDKDDNLPIAKAEGYLRYAGSTGRSPPVSVSIYRGAYHAWTVSSLGTAPRFYPQYPSTRNCPYILLGTERPSLLVDGQTKPLEGSAMQACLKDGQGYTMAYDSSARTRSTAETLDFLLKALQR